MRTIIHDTAANGHSGRLVEGEDMYEVFITELGGAVRSIACNGTIEDAHEAKAKLEGLCHEPQHGFIELTRPGSNGSVVERFEYV